MSSTGGMRHGRERAVLGRNGGSCKGNTTPDLRVSMEVSAVVSETRKESVR